MPTVTELGQLVKKKHPGAYDSIPDDYLGRMVKAKYPGSYDQFTESEPPRPMGKLETTPDFATRLRTKALANAPTILATAGGLAGLPAGPAASIGLATAGGAAGKGIQQYATGKEIDPGEIVAEGARQGAYEATGAALSATSAFLGRNTMKGALRAPDKLAREFPGVEETVLNRRYAIGKGLFRGRGVSGEERAAADMKLSAAKTKALLIDAKQGGWRASAKDVMREARDFIADPAVDDAERAQVQDLIDAFENQHAKGIDPLVLQRIKRKAQTSAKSTYSMAANDSRISQAAKKQFDALRARGAKRELQGVQGVAVQDKETQKLLGAKMALSKAERRAPMRLNLLMPETWPVAGAVAPQVESRAAIFLNNPAWRHLLRQSPRMFFALTGLSQEDVPDQTGAMSR